MHCKSCSGCIYIPNLSLHFPLSYPPIRSCSTLQSTLALLMDVLLSDSHDTEGLCQAAGRLVNALVAVYGPELVPGSTVFYRCKVRGSDASTFCTMRDSDVRETPTVSYHMFDPEFIPGFNAIYHCKIRWADMGILVGGWLPLCVCGYSISCCLRYDCAHWC